MVNKFLRLISQLASGDSDGEGRKRSWETVATRVILRAGLAVILLAGIVAPFLWLQSPLFDVGMLWEAGLRMRAGGADLYAAPTDPWNQVASYPYPPLFAALFAPLTFLPRAWGYAVWAVIQILAVGGGLWAAVWAGGTRSRCTRRQVLALVIVAVSGAVIVHMRQGQVNLLVLLAAAGGIGLLGRGRELAGGALVALSAHLKLIPVVLLGVLLITRRWRASGAMLAGLGLLTVVPAIWTGPDRGPMERVKAAVELNVEYATEEVLPRVLSHSPAGLSDASISNQSLWAVMQRWFGHGHALSDYEDVGRWTERAAPLFHRASGNWVHWLPPVLAVFLFLGALEVGRQIGSTVTGLALSSGLALLAVSLGNVVYWTHHAVVMALVLAPLWLLLSRRERRTTGIVAAVLAFVATWIGALGNVPGIDTLAVLGLPAFATLGVWILGWWGARSFGGRCDREIESPA